MRSPSWGSATVPELFQRREFPIEDLADNASVVAVACHAIAQRFHQGGKLIVFGNGGPSTDAQHVSVEFVHPVIVGKRALPAISLTADVATVTGIARQVGFDEVFAHQLQYLAEPQDIALGLSTDGDCTNVLRGLDRARELGMLTIGLVGGSGGAISVSPSVDHVLIARSDDPFVVKEVHVTMYHVLWELTHVFLEQPGLLAPEVIV
ncbi:MAG: D-sedoheptulose-7-phosphate isomerase [Sciscionella sp.]